MKADVVHFLSGQTVLAVAGVNTLTQLELILPQLRGQGVERIMTAFDMDFMENPHVQNGYPFGPQPYPRAHKYGRHPYAR